MILDAVAKTSGRQGYVGSGKLVQSTTHCNYGRKLLFLQGLLQFTKERYFE